MSDRNSLIEAIQQAKAKVPFLIGQYGSNAVQARIMHILGEAYHVIGRGYELLNLVPIEKINHMPDSVLSRVHSPIVEFVNNTESWMQQSANWHAREQTSSKVADLYENLYRAIGDSAIYLTSTHQNQFGVLINNLSSQVDKAKFESDNAHRAAEDAHRIVNEMKDAAGDAGVLKAVLFFKGESEEHGTAAGRWLWVCGLLSAAILFCVLYPVSSSIINMFGRNVDSAWLDKILLLLVLFTALVFSSRAYAANRHNYVINKHRHNSLLVYKPLVEASQKDKLARDAILAAASTAIFAPQDTGYAKVANEERSSSVLEAMARAIQTK